MDSSMDHIVKDIMRIIDDDDYNYIEPRLRTFSCSSCYVKCKDLKMYREHCTSECHNCNMLRKAAKLPTYPLKYYEIIKQREVSELQEIKSTESQKWQCTFCRKKFKNQKQHENHLRSKSHKKKASKENVGDKTIIEDSANMMEIETDSVGKTSNSEVFLEQLIGTNKCLFCNVISESIECSLQHMKRQHSFFVPDLEYCINVEDLLLYLADKIYERQCIWCNEKFFCDTEAAKRHMIDKGHCKMYFEEDKMYEYEDFYDYSSKSQCGEGSVVPVDLLDDGSYNLPLPSGKVVGHRSLMLYYKQNLYPETDSADRAKSKDCQQLPTRMQRYRALGGPEMQLDAAEKTSRDIQYSQRVQAKYSTQLQFKQNKLQKNYKRLVLF